MNNAFGKRDARLRAEVQHFNTFVECDEFVCLFVLARQPPSGPWPPHSRGSYITHNEAPQSVGLLWMSDQLIAETSTWQCTQHSQQKNVHALGGIRTHDLCRRATADPRLRPRGHWNRDVESRNPLLTAKRWNKTRGPRLTGTWISGERFVACRHAKRSELRSSEICWIT